MTLGGRSLAVRTSGGEMEPQEAVTKIQVVSLGEGDLLYSTALGSRGTEAFRLRVSSP